MSEAGKGDKGDKGKKGEKEKKPAGGKVGTTLGEILAIIIALYFLGKFVVSAGLTGGNFSFQRLFNNALQATGTTSLFHTITSTFVLLSSIFSIAFILGLAYVVPKLRKVEHELEAPLKPLPDKASLESMKNERFQRVLAHINTDNASDWRLAILECDIVLDELLDSIGYIGGTIGDKLKEADPAPFKTLNNAWEAHKIRNAIAHEGQDFTLTKREARRIVALYESVFREFDFV